MPERIGAYRLESPLGRGGMGEVYLAWDERLERAVAIKRIRHDAFVQSHQRERFRREARMAARLSHAAIVQVHDLVSEESGDAIVMEYVEGPTLAERLARGPLGIAEAVHLAREISEGLAAAHEAGLIHRDLKAENVVITPSGHAKILDFGLARPVCWDGEMLTQHGALVGTCYAMSPEQASGGDLDERSDLFSLGALLYEMLAGQSAFRAKDPRTTLQRVLYEQPTPLEEVRPDVPPALVSLVERLLAKDREGRPRSAARVAQKLERIARELPEESFPQRNDDSVSEMPTQAFAALPFERSAPPAPRSSSAVDSLARPLRRARGWILFLAGALAALVIAVVASYLLPRKNATPESPLRVVVYTQVPKGERLHAASTSILSAAISGLSSLEGISPVDPSIGGPPGASPREVARAFAAQEVLLVQVELPGTLILRRLASDGAVLGSSEPFRVSLDSDELSILANTIVRQIQDVYSDHPPHPGTPKFEVRDADYTAFLDLRSKVGQGSSLDDSDLAGLRDIIRSSPRFLDALILASEVYRSRFQSTKNPADRDLALEYARQAQELSASDPRPAISHFKIALEGDLAVAEAALARIEELMHGDPQFLVYRASLADRQGQPHKALADLRRAIEQIPSWRNLYDLADLELRLGYVDEARGHLDKLLQVSPENPWGMSRLADLEVLYGDIAKAENLYLQLAHLERRRSYFTNLGVVRSLQGKYREAIEAYKQALDITPGHPWVMLNLAEAELALGHRVEAENHFHQTLERLEERQKVASLSVEDRMTQAQCLARLGKVEQAVGITLGALKHGSEDPQMLYMAALVYSLAQERNSALFNAKAALRKGLRPDWFQPSVFDPLKEDPELRALLDKPASSGS